MRPGIVLAGSVVPRWSGALLASLTAELFLLVGALALLRLREVRRRRRAPAGTLYQGPAAVASDTLHRFGAVRKGRARGPVRRPVQTHSGVVAVTDRELAWKPDAYSRRHGGRRLVVPLAGVRWTRAVPRVLGLGSLLLVGLDDGSTVRFVTRGNPEPLRKALERVGVVVSR